MSPFSLPCSFFLGKAFAACDSDYPSVRFPILLLSHLGYLNTIINRDAHFREKWHSLLGEAAFIFLVPHLLSHLWTEAPAGSVLWRVIRDEYDGDTRRFSRDRKESMIRHEGEVLNGIER